MGLSEGTHIDDSQALMKMESAVKAGNTSVDGWRVQGDDTATRASIGHIATKMSMLPLMHHPHATQRTAGLAMLSGECNSQQAAEAQYNRTAHEPC